jgi:putative restriction endonuclease
MERAEIKEKFSKINSWQKGDRRAPHKPLLILYALGCCSRGEPKEITFTKEFDRKFTQLLKEFGTSKSPSNSHHPFWYLRNDGIWEVSKETGMESRKGKVNEPLKRELLKYEVSGGFIEPIYQELISDKKLLIEITEQILEDNFPESFKRTSKPQTAQRYS